MAVYIAFGLLKKNKLEKIDIDDNFRKNLAEEFKPDVYGSLGRFRKRISYGSRFFHGERLVSAKSKIAHYLP